MNIAPKLQELLDSSGISRSRLAREIGVHTSTVSNWLDGKTVKSENLTTLCTYFNCSLDYLTGAREETQKAPASNGERNINDEDIKFALFGGDGEITPEMYAEVKRFAAFVKQREKEKQE